MGVVEIVVVEVEEETKIKTKVNPTLTPPLVPIRRSRSIRVRSIQIFQPETGVKSWVHGDDMIIEGKMLHARALESNSGPRC